MEFRDGERASEIITLVEGQQSTLEKRPLSARPAREVRSKLCNEVGQEGALEVGILKVVRMEAKVLQDVQVQRQRVVMFLRQSTTWAAAETQSKETS